MHTRQKKKGDKTNNGRHNVTQKIKDTKVKSIFNPFHLFMNKICLK